MLKCVFWDVEHGNAACIRTPTDQHIAVDLGTGSYGDSNLEFSPLLHLKHKWNQNRLRLRSAGADRVALYWAGKRRAQQNPHLTR